jgi:hypothetical protein
MCARKQTCSPSRYIVRSLFSTTVSVYTPGAMAIESPVTHMATASCRDEHCVGNLAKKKCHNNTASMPLSALYIRCKFSTMKSRPFPNASGLEETYRIILLCFLTCSCLGLPASFTRSKSKAYIVPCCFSVSGQTQQFRRCWDAHIISLLFGNF